MSLLTIVIVIILAGVGLYLVNSVIPMEATMKKVLNVVVFSLLGGHGGVGAVSLPRIC
jgi:hypothetical protein